MKNIKTTVAIVGVILIFLFLKFGIHLIQWKDNNNRDVVTPKNEFQLEEETYRPPVLPLLKDKQPVKTKDLPIPKKDVAKTIEIIPTEGTGKITLIEDKKGNLYVSKDTPKDVKIEVTKWKPRVFAVSPRFGYTLVYSNQAYHCLSLDVLRIWNFNLGGEFGFIGQGNYLLGASLKYRIATLELLNNLGLEFSAVAGKDFLHGKAYVGVNIKMR